jgi:hypothetical protein
MPKDSDAESFDWGTDSDSDDAVEPPPKVGPPKGKAINRTEVKKIISNHAVEPPVKIGPPKGKAVKRTESNAQPTQTSSESQTKASMKIGPPSSQNVKRDSGSLPPPTDGTSDPPLKHSSAFQANVDVPRGILKHTNTQNKSCSRPEVSRHHVSQPEVSMKIGPPKKPANRPHPQTPIPSIPLPGGGISNPHSKDIQDPKEASTPPKNPCVQSFNWANLSTSASDQVQRLKIGPPRDKSNRTIDSRSPAHPGFEGSRQALSRPELPGQDK